MRTVLSERLFETKGRQAKEFLEFPLEVKAEDVGEDGTFKGYGSTFNGPPDVYGDVVIPGAFSKTLTKGGRNGTGVAMLWQHDYRMPVGIWTALSEDKRGLLLEGQLATDTQTGGDAYKLLKMGAVKGLSIGFNTVKYEIDKTQNIRKLTEVELWEVSLVTFPANVRARVTGVKSIFEASTEREMETALREAGMNHHEARFLVRLCKPSLREAGRAEGEGLNAVLEALKNVNSQYGKN